MWGPGPAALAHCGNMLEMQTPRPHLRPMGTLSPLTRHEVLFALYLEKHVKLAAHGLMQPTTNIFAAQPM